MNRSGPRLAWACMLVALVVAVVCGRQGPDEALAAPGDMTVPAVVRDFLRHDMARGHPDFFRRTSGVAEGDVQSRLDAHRRPRAAGARAFSFASWFRDTPGVNISRVVPLTFVCDDGRYVFDSRAHEPWHSRGGFFPIDDQLYGNVEGFGGAHNWNFTTELRVDFRYDRNNASSMTVASDGDVWVFIDGRLVVDLGGAQTRHERQIRLEGLGLRNGMLYEIAVFQANRQPGSSTLRIEFGFPVFSRTQPMVFGAFD